MKKSGFTLIELILVLGLVTTLTALAAPQFMAILDDQEDTADVAQMDQLMVAFQLEQAPFYEDHQGTYDILNGLDGDESEAERKSAASTTLQVFLEDALTSPGSTVYMEGVKSFKTGESPTGEDLIYEVASSDTHVWLVRDNAIGPDTPSKIKAKIPGLDPPIEDPYSAGQLQEGTWMVVGDDDRLRADYVESLLRSGDSEESFIYEASGKDQYKYRTEFMIAYEVPEDEETESGQPMYPDDKWITWDPVGANSATKIMIERGDLRDFGEGYEEIEISYSLNGASFVDLGDESEVALTNNSNGKKAFDQIDFRFTMDGSETKIITYKVSIMQEKKWDDFVDYYDLEDQLEEVYSDDELEDLDVFTEDVNKIPGIIRVKDNGNPHILYYTSNEQSHTDDDDNESDDESNVDAKGFTFHAGPIFNYVNDQNYDAILIEADEDQDLKLRYYQIRPGGTSLEKEKDLKGFTFNEWYELNLTVKDSKAMIEIGDKEYTFSISSTLVDAIGFYMNESVDLDGQDAVSTDPDEVPLVRYNAEKKEGPLLILKDIPQFYEGESDEEDDEDDYEWTISLDPEEEASERIKVRIQIPGYDGETSIETTIDGDSYSAGNLTFPSQSSFYLSQNGKLKIEAELDNGQKLKWEKEISNIDQTLSTDELVFDYGDESKIKIKSDYDVAYVWVSEINQDPESISLEDEAYTHGKSFTPAESGWLFARIQDDDGTSDWIYRPFVYVDDWSLTSKIADDDATQQEITPKGTESMPSDFVWVFEADGSDQEGASIHITNAQNMDTKVSAYVKWQDSEGEDRQISESLETSFDYINGQTLEVQITISVWNAKKSQYSIYVRANQTCTIDYILSSGDEGRQKIKSNKVGQDIRIIKKTTASTISIEADTGSETITGDFPITASVINSADEGWQD